MSNAVLIVGKSGSGKSTSIRTLPSEKTFIINCLDKPLPFRGWKGLYKTLDESNKNGNYFASDNPMKIVKILDYIDKERKDIEYIVLDDYIYTMSNEYMMRADEKGFDKFTEIGKKAWMVANKAKSLRENLNVAILTHVDEIQDSSGFMREKVKTIGKLVDNVVVLEGMFTTVLYTTVTMSQDELKYEFSTKNSGYNTCKSPDGMFPSSTITNDLKLVFDSMEKYYFD
jgi:adenylate kinase family enzyme